MGIKKTQKTIFDTNYKGYIDVDGGVRTHWNEDALNQSVKLWLTSLNGDIVRGKRRGGYVMPHFMKPMSATNSDNIAMSIRNGFYQDFKPYLEINELIVTPNYEERYWHIYMEIYSPDLKMKTTVDEKIKATV